MRYHLEGGHMLIYVRLKNKPFTRLLPLMNMTFRIEGNGPFMGQLHLNSFGNLLESASTYLSVSLH